MAELNFNGANAEAMDDYSVVPAGVYNSQIVKSDIVPTKKKDGTLLKLQYKIIDGKFKGRTIFGQYNLTNPNEQAVQISKTQIKTLCDAIGKPDGFSDTTQLHNIPLQIKIAVKPASGPYAESNEIKFYDKYKGEAVVQEAAATATKSKPDWA